jgi:hypothetical protein
VNGENYITRRMRWAGHVARIGGGQEDEEEELEEEEEEERLYMIDGKARKKETTRKTKT